eukprot:CAMPEP_0117770968 /NCGR_PEP_ID=MMETSP0947-20121206/24163_1 /TAXON_ID=44440 /ORGANISM="Chattonella subsalsa, Strain CCMP2191" /LENGTH=569 /DNA_ID=CAMNT_0005596195 /DNA_START=83 /DNA_END=1789 /DNA_ORIENTATION=-
MGPKITSHLFHFKGMDGHSGVVVGGWRPAVILCQRGQVNVYPLHPNNAPPSSTSKDKTKATDKEFSLYGFSALHHPVMGSGCLWLSTPRHLAVYATNGTLHFDAGGASGYTAFKVTLGQTVHKVCYLGLGDAKNTFLAKVLATPTYALITSTKVDEAEIRRSHEKMKQPEKPVEEDEYQTEDVITDWVEPDPEFGGVPKTYISSYKIELVTSNGWQTLWSQQLDPYEHGLAMDMMTIGDKEKKIKVIVIGTGYTAPEGEDEICLGRLFVYEMDVASYVLEGQTGEQVRQVPKLKELIAPLKEKGPVSAVAKLGPHVLVAVGPKLKVYLLDHHKGGSPALTQVGFFDTQVYVVTLSTVKNFVLVGDYCNSISFLVWNEKDRVLIEQAKAYRPAQTMGASFVLDPPSLGLLVSDYDRNIQMFQFSQLAVEARGGNKLLCKADFQLGSHATFYIQHKANTSILQHHQSAKKQTRYSLIFGALDGGVGAFVPVDERVFRRLYALQGVMINAIQHNASLNPRAFRLFVSFGFHDGRKKNVINGALVWRFVHFDARFQNRLASAIGTTVGTIINN